MALLSVYDISQHFGERELFSHVTFEVGERDKIGLCGVNGCGKTTLFRMLTGELSSDTGSVTLSRETRIGYMEQHLGQHAERTLWEETLSVFEPLMQKERELEAIHTALETAPSETLIERQQLLQEQIEAAGGLYYQSRVRSTLLGLGFAEADFGRSVATFSGGQRSKAAMARLLLSDANLLLLDEPTNHLDMEASEWLEGFLQGFAGAVIVISHDRYFLDQVTNRTFEISGGRLYTTRGNYSVHREQREKERETEEKHYKLATEEIRRKEESIERFRRFNREKSIRAAESKQKAVDKLKEQLVRPESAEKEIRFGFSAETVSGNEVLNVEQLSMGFGGKPLFSHVDFQIRRGDRVFLLGANGCGKTTLLKILHGQYTPLHGSVRFGAKVSVGYYDQTQEGLSPQKTVLEELSDAYPQMTGTELRSALALFLFCGEDVFRPVSLLSGGEKARLLLLKLMLQRDNFLLLDEPTNHLDIASREALESALEGYDGTMLIVSHDRYFINRLANKILYFREDGCCMTEGNYTAYAEARRAVAQVAPPPHRAESGGEEYRRRKEQESERRKLQTRARKNEEEIAAAEQEAASLREALETADPAQYEELVRLSSALEEQNRKLEQLMEEWERLQLALEDGLS